MFESLLLVWDGVRLTGVGECVECRAEADVTVAGDEGLEITVVWVELIDEARVGL